MRYGSNISEYKRIRSAKAVTDGVDQKRNAADLHHMRYWMQRDVKFTLHRV